MSSIVSFVARSFCVFFQALATKLAETNTATAIAVPQVHMFDIVEMVSSVNKRAIEVVIPTARPVCMSIGIETRRNGAAFPNCNKTKTTHVAAPIPQTGISAG